MDIETKGKGIAQSVLIGLLLATLLITSGCGGDEGEAAQQNIILRISTSFGGRIHYLSNLPYFRYIRCYFRPDCCIRWNRLMN